MYLTCPVLSMNKFAGTACIFQRFLMFSLLQELKKMKIDYCPGMQLLV
jgi:hypothetical protein